MCELMETFAFPGQIVMSPFLGSGTTLLAAYRNGNHAFGWDLSEQYKEGFMRAAQEEISWHIGKEVRNGDVEAEAK
jgi:DNA modification methylase